MLRGVIICLLGIFLNLDSIARTEPIFHKEVLKSGVTCYFIKTDEPTIDYYLVQNTGSALERPEEDGLAHLIEHMSFLSTLHFPGTVSRFLDRHQIANNASTYQDKIIYYMEKVPADNQSLNDSCLFVLHDWCGFLSLNTEELEKEKKAIVEEWRGGRRPDRNQQEFARLLYNNTRFARLSSLGNIDFVRTVGSEQLRTFCREWFNPALAAIIIKGNFDMAECRKNIEQIFADVAVSPDYRLRQPVVVPDNDSVYFRQMEIPANMANTLVVSLRIPDEPAQELEAFCRDRFYADLYRRIMKMRMERYQNSSVARTNNFTIEYKPVMKGYEMLHLELSSLPGYELMEFGRMVACHEGLTTQGLSVQEQEMLKQSYPYQFFTFQEEFSPLQVAEDNYLRNYPLFTADEYNRAVKKFAGDFNNEEFIGYCRKKFEMRNLAVVVYCSPQNTRVLSRKAVLDVINDPKKEFPQADLKMVSVAIPPAGVLQKEEQIAGCDAVIWTYANGAKVIYRYLPGKDIQLVAVRAGGLASFSAWDLAVGKALTPFAGLTGTSDYQKQDLDAYAFANRLEIDQALEKNEARIKASCPVATYESLLKLLYLRLEKTRFEAVNPYVRSRIAAQLSGDVANRDQYKMSLYREIYGPDKQEQQITRTYLDQVTPEKLQSAYDRIFGNARGWVYVVTGGIPAVKAKEYMDIYIGGLSSDGSGVRTPEPRKFLVKKDIVRTILLNTPDNNGGTDMNYVYPESLETTDRMLAEVLTKIMRNRCNRELRDVRSAIYGMYLETFGWNYPEPLTVLNVNFGSKKEDQEPIAAYIQDEFQRIVKKGVSASEIDEASKMLDWEGLGQKMFIQSCCETGLLSPARLTDVCLIDRQAVTPENVQRFARKFLSESRIVRFVFK